MNNPACEECPLHVGAQTVCMEARGNTTDPSIVFVGESPSSEDDDTGRPFSGRVGRILADAIKAAGIQNYAITYAVKCRAPGDRNPKAKELAACRKYLDAELAKWKPRIVVPMGNIALKALTKKTGILSYAGMAMEDPDLPFAVFPLIHPAALLKPGKNREPKFTADILALAMYAQDGKKVHTFDRLQRDSMIRWLEEVAASDFDYWTVDFETTHLNPKFGNIVSVAFSCAGDTVWCEWSDRFLNPLVALFKTGMTMVAHNAAFELKWILHHVLKPMGVPNLTWPVHDTMLFHHLLNEEEQHDLSYLSKVYTEYGGYDDAVQALKLAGVQHGSMELSVLGQYNAGDAAATAELQRIWRPKIDHYFPVYYRDFVEPAIWAIMHAEYNGRRVDLDVASDLNETLKAEEDETREAIMTHPAVMDWEVEWHRDGIPGLKKPRKANAERGVEPERFNPNSSKQLGDLLFRKMGVEQRGETDTGAPSVSEKFLTPLRGSNPFLDTYLRYKKVVTLRNNYLGTPRTPDDPKGSGILGFVEPNQFLYGSYLLHGTVTGRLASQSPNLQNFTQRLRTIVRSRFGDGLIMEADFSQLELRLAAWASGCKPLIDAYLAGEDVHRLTAQRVLKIGYGIDKTLAEITSEERQNFGKRVNFGLLYGAYPKRLTIEWGVSLKEAKRIRDAFHQAYPELGHYVRRQQQRAERGGKVVSHFGRIRRLPAAQFNVGDDWGDPRKKAKTSALLQASNFGIQSLGNDLNTWSFAQITEYLRESDFRSMGIGVTHDSGTYDCPASEVGEVAVIVRDVMVRGVAEVFPEIEIPMAIEVKVGPSWGELEPYVFAT